MSDQAPAARAIFAVRNLISGGPSLVYGMGLGPGARVCGRPIGRSNSFGNLSQRYTEVAVISQVLQMGRSLGAGLRASAAVGVCALSLGLLGGAGGCAGGQDMVTFPGESRQQGIKLYNEGNIPDATAAFTNAI